MVRPPGGRTATTRLKHHARNGAAGPSRSAAGRGPRCGVGPQEERDAADASLGVAANRAAVAFRPLDAAAHHNLGRVLLRAGRLADAAASFGVAAALDHGSAAARADLGLAFARLGRTAEAVVAFREALWRAPGDADAHANLGTALAALGQRNAAVAAFTEAIRLRPDHADAYSNLGVTLAAMDRTDEAAAACAAAIRFRPDHANAHANLGLALIALGRFEEAIAAFARAIAIEPRHPNANLNLALVLLLLGRFERGWEAYEHRGLASRNGGAQRASALPQWRGEPLDGRTVLLHAEQGLGDTIQFARYAPLVARRGAGRVLLLVQAPLRRLLAGLPGVDGLLMPGEALPPFDLHCPLLSLPGVFRTALDTVPAEIPYLRPEPGAAARWRERLTPLHGLRVGLVWSGNPGHTDDRNRSVPFEALSPLWRVPGVSWVGLQVGQRAGDPRRAGDSAVHDLSPALGDFAETAAAIAALDLVVTVDTAVAHLAGALGQPVWLLLPRVPDWRWLLGREDSPWYPTARLFRQERPGDWAGVIGRVTAELEAFAACIATHERGARQRA